jgi:tetratricopeptide (TPR) repeat protein
MSRVKLCLKKPCAVFAASLGLLLLVNPHSVQAEVRVWQGTLTLPVYEEGSPDPNPPFDLYATTRFNYPYTIRDNLTNHRANHALRAIYLENEYLKCSVLPDIGGHLYTCLDKINGQPMFYANPSIKKAGIGYRGAWAAFGIEFNFPVSHNWVSMSPVDFAFRKNPDGSASAFVGNIDRVYGMEWTVELVLRPQSTVLEERVTLNNRSDVRHRFYWWNNAGVQVWDDSHVEYPMRYAASHGFKQVQTWPVDSNGTDLSIIRNQTYGPVSLFVHGSREPFMAIWNPKTNAGTVHYADYGDLPGKKIWSWGVDPDGLDWRRALSDNDSAYVEVQGGLFRNQETYAFLQPRQTIRFSEYWLPVRGIGGIARANLAGVLNTARHGANLTAAFNSSRPVQNASLRVVEDGHALLDEHANLDPETIWTRNVHLSDPAHKCTFELRGPDGTLLLRHTEGEYDWTPESEIHVGPRTAHAVPQLDARSEGDWLDVGKDDELNGILLDALDAYRQGLRKFPGSFGLGLAAGRLAAGLLLYDEAVTYLEPVQERDTPNPEVAYYLALAYEGKGDDRRALANFETAQRLPPFHAAATLKLGELHARQGDLKLAERYLAEALRSAPPDIRATEELSAVKQAAGEKEAASSFAKDLLAASPLSYFLREQLGDPDLAHLAADPYRVLNIASEYIRLGFYKSALQVLSRDYPEVPMDQREPGYVLPQRNALVGYFRAWCREKLGQPFAADYSQAEKLSIEYIFPHTAEALQVLRSALRVNPSDGTAHYLLGTFYFSRGLTDPALTEWTKARELNPDIPVLDASTGLAMMRVKRDPAGALKVFREGLSTDQKNDQIYFGLDQALSLLASPASERVSALEKYPDSTRMPTALVYELALNREEAGDFKGALDLFHGRFFPREEGGTNVRQVWFEVQLQQVLSAARNGNCAGALAGSEHLGTPVPDLAFTKDGLEPMLQSARTNYLLGTIESQCERPERAQARYSRAAQASELNQLVWARAAAEKLPGFDGTKWTGLLKSALAQSQVQRDLGSATSWSLYNSGLLKSALGDKESASADFEAALLLPDRLLAYHLIRLARGAAHAM